MHIRHLMNLVEALKMVGPYPEESTPFYLPVSVIAFYDDPYAGVGDDGYDIDTLKAEIERDGGVIYSIQVGKSAASNDGKVYVFNGNHRLAACKELGIPEIICENAGYDDAVPLTVDEILALGGRFLD